MTKLEEALRQAIAHARLYGEREAALSLALQLEVVRTPPADKPRCAELAI